jgi:hypothetical protein
VKKGGLVVLGLVLLVGAAFLVDVFWLPGSASVAELPSGENRPFGAPQWLGADLDEQQIILRWRSVPGALAYTLWQSSDPEGEFRVIHMGRDTTYEAQNSLNPGETSCYLLTATDPEFDESGFSPPRCVISNRAGDPESR